MSIIFKRRLHINSTGFTLIELLVTTVLTTIALCLVFFSRNYISRHTIEQQRRSLFFTETNRISMSISNAIRKSPEILECSDNQIVFLSAITFDTLSYAFINGDIYRNGTIISSVIHDLRFTEMLIKNHAEYNNADNNTVLLSIYFAAEDSFKNKSDLTINVKVNIPPDRMGSL